MLFNMEGRQRKVGVGARELDSAGLEPLDRSRAWPGRALEAYTAQSLARLSLAIERAGQLHC